MKFKNEIKKNKFSNSNFNKNKSVKNKLPIEHDRMWLYGKHPVFLCLFHQKRKIYKILLTKNTAQELEKFAKEKQIKIDQNLIQITTTDEIANNLPMGAVHQGFALKTLPLQLINDQDFLIQISKLEKDSLPPILILDNLTDPHNIGAIARSAAAFGIKNIVVTERNFPGGSAIIAKSSSGAIELVDLVTSGNLNHFLGKLKEIGYWCIGLDGSTNNLLTKAKEFKPIALIVGSEGDGIRHLVKENCDLLVKIPMSPNVESLNASNAVAISLYELFK